jgi:hypothetical protein
MIDRLEHLAKLVENEIRGYRCRNAVDEEGQGLQLLDVIGAEEVDALVDAVVGEVMSLNILHLSPACLANSKPKKDRLDVITVLDDHLDEPGEAEGGSLGLHRESASPRLGVGPWSDKHHSEEVPK